jgi:flagellar biosynthesis/type III secretory pathway chaperone
MNILLDSLSEILKEIVENYSLLLNVFQRERRFIIENSLSGIHDCIKQKETVILKLKMLEDSRVAITDKLTDLFKASLVTRHSSLVTPITLSYLSDSTAEPYSSTFKNYRSMLLSLVQSIRDLNRENKNFIEISMDTIRESFKFLNDATNPRPTYLSSGAVHSQVQRGRMVKSIG